VTEPVKVVFFGDSICFGQGVSLHRGWVTRIAAKLSELTDDAGRELLVVNASVNGNTTRQALERMPYDVQSHGVDVLIVQFGMNDCNYWESDRGNPRVSVDAFAANLAEIVSRAVSFGARTVLLNTNHPTGRDQHREPFADKTYEESNRRYNEVIRHVAATHTERGVVLNDIEAAFDAATGGTRDALLELLLPDLLHPNERGHDLYYSVVQPAVEQAARDAAAVA
jgi:acyl-CoA thioesterase I